MTEKRTVYVFGDTGTDLLVRPGDGGQLDMPAGAHFMSTVLDELISDVFKIVPLLEAESAGRGTTSSNDITTENVLELTRRSVPASVRPMGRRVAQLNDYSGTTRLKSYGPSKGNDVHEVSFGGGSLGSTAEGRKMFALSEPPSGEHFEDNFLLVGHHAGGPWDDQAERACSELIGRMARTSPRWLPFGFPQVLINLSSELPEPNRDPEPYERHGGDKAVHPFRSELWNELFTARDRIGIVVSMSTLRAARAVVSRRLSIEHLVEDFCADLHLFPRLSLLARFRHLFVRVGMVAVIHIENVSDGPFNEKFTGEVYFSPYAEQGLHRDYEQDGGTFGRNAALIGAFAYALHQKASEAEPHRGTPRDFYRLAIERALLGMKDLDDHGYKLRPDSTGESVIRAAANVARAALRGLPEDRFAANWKNAESAFGCRPIPRHLLNPLPPNEARTSQPWHILDEVLREAPVHRINVAMAIVVAGHERVLNRRWPVKEPSDEDRHIWPILSRVEYWEPNDSAPDFVTMLEGYPPAMPRGVAQTPLTTPAIIGNTSALFELSIPVMKFGALRLVERREIESLRSIQNLLRLHRAQATRTRAKGKVHKPISIAVFGPPGTGKSFAVKQLAAAVGSEAELPHMEFNVAQFSGVSDLYDALKQVSARVDATKGEPLCTPLVFFDEFDCGLEDSELGWLKYFLAPMQDGKLKDGSTDIGPAIFVFAGGTKASFGRFDPRTDSAYDNLRNSDEYQQKVRKFGGQKGPDFISRLRGHIDVLPINNEAGRPKHFIRRAMQLRSFLQLNEFVDQTTGIANIDQAIVYALLTADRFRHGVRSIQAIVEMCSPIHGRLEIASLPARSQLEMHVDANEFMVRVHRGRTRTMPEYCLKVREFEWARRTLREHLRDVEAIRDVDYSALSAALDGQAKGFVREPLPDSTG